MRRYRKVTYKKPSAIICSGGFFIRVYMKRILSILFFLLALIIAFETKAQELDQDIAALCNKTVQEIYNAILTQKDRYPELSAFNESTLTKNEFGLLQLQYESSFMAADQSFQFHLTFLPTETAYPFPEGYKTFQLGFPLLDMKLTGFKNKQLKKDQFDISKLIEQFGLPLWDEQQRFNMYHLEIIPDKTTYTVEEEIEFVVRLTNEAETARKFKNLNSKTVRIEYASAPAVLSEDFLQNAKKEKERVVFPGKSIETRFRTSGFDTPSDVTIRATYAMTYKSIHPSAKVVIRIQSQQ